MNNEARERYEERMREIVTGIALGTRYAQQLPAETLDERALRANRLMGALRVMKMGKWRPTFPYLAPRRRLPLDVEGPTT